MAGHNDAIIDEFRSNGGKVGGHFARMNLLLLTTTGARSGQPRTSPVAYRADGDRLLVFATYAGRDENPLWYRNLVADPKVTVEVGTETYQATATPLTGDERDREWRAMVAQVPAFGDYETRTTRVIPVVALERTP